MSSYNELVPWEPWSRQLTSDDIAVVFAETELSLYECASNVASAVSYANAAIDQIMVGEPLPRNE